jgi:hypothetical protein
MPPSDAASDAPSKHCTNGYASENRVFSFCERMASVAKIILCCLEKLSGRVRRLINGSNPLSWLIQRLPAKRYSPVKPKFYLAINKNGARSPLGNNASGSIQALLPKQGSMFKI